MTQSVSVPRSRKAAKEITLGDDGLPVLKRDDVDFVARALLAFRTTAGKYRPAKIAEIVRSLGFQDRALGGGPTAVYLRIRVALVIGKDRGVFECEDHRWWVAGTI